MVVPFAAGGAFDVLARVFAPHLSMSLGQQVIVENVGAAAGIVGTNRVAKATPDGYVFLFGSVGRSGERLRANNAMPLSVLPVICGNAPALLEHM